MAMKKDLKYEIVEHFGVISEKGKGWRREINKVSWNDAEPKFDIRDWSSDHQKMGKGITLTEEELMTLMEIAEENVFSGQRDAERIIFADQDLWGE